MLLFLPGFVTNYRRRLAAKSEFASPVGHALYACLMAMTGFFNFLIVILPEMRYDKKSFTLEES